MNAILLSAAGLLGAAAPFVLDAALKGAALLAAAALVALALFRASAATRHLAWLAAMAALVAVPFLGAALPAWRALPEWAHWTPAGIEPLAPAPAPAIAADDGHEAEPPAEGAPRAPDASRGQREPALAAAAPSIGAAPPPVAGPPSAAPPLGGGEAMPLASFAALAWAAGVALLALRLAVAQGILRRKEGRCTRLSDGDGSTGDGSTGGDAAIARAVAEARARLGVRQRVTTLLDPERGIPSVFGVLRPRLVLPEDARRWSAEELRSVLLHELAHIRRRDTLAQWIAHVACALHWWNPLAWLAAWRLRAECERACDDLVLAGGVRPSVYAEQLVRVATTLAPARRIAACGLAMARSSSLESRLAALLSARRSRRGLTPAIAAAAILSAAALAIPIAMLRAQEREPAGAPPQGAPASAAADAGPKDEEARALLAVWRERARENGDLPGALVARLGEKVKEFIRNNDGDATGGPLAVKFAPLVPLFDEPGDWTAADAVALLDAVAAVSTIPLETSLDRFGETRVTAGAPLPDELRDAPWGLPSPEGLRAAWLFDPRADSYPVGTPLRSRILLHNDGKEPIVIRMPTWLQSGAHAARDAAGDPLEIESTSWTTLPFLRTWRLAPGELCEISTPGIGVGQGAGKDEWADVRVGSWIDVAEGVDVVFFPAAVDTRVYDGRTGGRQAETPRDLKLQLLDDALECERPLPAGAVDRERILRKVLRDVFGAAPTAGEIAAFVSDTSRDPIAALRAHLVDRPGLAAFAGEIRPGEIRFRTTAADPEAASRPKVAIGPGRYTLGENVRLIIVGRPVDGRRTSDIEIRSWAAEPNAPPPGEPYAIDVPHGFGTWAIACRPGTGVLWVFTAGAVRRIDYGDPAHVVETTVAPGSSEDAPPEFREAARRALRISGVADDRIAELLALSAADASAAPRAPRQSSMPRAGRSPVS